MTHYPNYTPAPKKKSKLPLILGIAAAVALICCGGVVAIGASQDKKPAPAPTAVASEVRSEKVAAPVQTTAAAPASAVATPAAPKVPTIADGTWTVGEDFPAGNYRTTGSGSNCYWSITKSGTNGSDIVDNHIGGGNLRVTLKAGQDFETSRCGTWSKV